MFQRIGPAAYKVDLGNIVELMDAMKNPENDFKSIHVAGTNGKGSSSHMLASILQEAGYKVGLYTSPHLKSFTERIRVNGREIREQEVVDFVEGVNSIINKIEPSFFEVTVAMAFDYFSKNNVDIAIIEVGLGGRLDSTNIINPEVSLITNIGLDHQSLLGETLEKIAIEKAGIIKRDVPVVISQRQAEVAQIFVDIAKYKNTSVVFAADTILIEQVSEERINVFQGDEIIIEGLKPDLKGRYQQLNIPGVVQAVKLVKGFKISDDNIRDGLENVAVNTGFKGRWQVLSKEPLVICDTGHNVDGVKLILEQLKTLSYKRLHIVWGMVEDKSLDTVLSLMPTDAIYYFCAANIPRALESNNLKSEAQKFRLVGNSYNSVKEAITGATISAEKEDLIFIGGSTFVVAEIEEL
jgi:dihydrofolate synthase / folylpolyglutamate synthase